MKKLLALFLTAVMLLCVAGCSSKEEKTAPTDVPETEKDEAVIDSEWTTLDNCKFRVVECVFDANLTAQDEEYHTTLFSPAEKDYVYVDLVLELENTGTEPLGKNDISGYFMYNDLREDMEFVIENRSNTGYFSSEMVEVDGVSQSVDATVKSGETAFVHLNAFGVNKEDVGCDITVVYTVDGNEFEEKVTVKEEKDLLGSKTEIKVGDVIDVNGKYSFEVLDCSVGNYVYATNTAESEAYRSSGGAMMADVVIKLKNNTDATIENPYPYTIINETVYKGFCGIEVENNTKIAGMSGLGHIPNPPLEAGSEEICHLLVAGIEETNADNVIVRFNLDGVCFYCKTPKA